MTDAPSLAAPPAVTTDLEQATADLDELEIARLVDALPADEVAAPQARPWAAAAEAAARVAFFDGGDGATQRVWNLPSTGAPPDLLRHPRRGARPRAHVLDGDHCLSRPDLGDAGRRAEVLLASTLTPAPGHPIRV
jgi:hypothetical protein